jgi:hypothetical protein
MFVKQHNKDICYLSTHENNNNKKKNVAIFLQNIDNDKK